MFIAYRPRELVTFDTVIHQLNGRSVIIDDMRVQAVACMAPYRTGSELVAKLMAKRKLTIDDLQRIATYEIYQAPFTALIQGCHKDSGAPFALQVSGQPSKVAAVGRANPHRDQLLYCSKPGLPFLPIRTMVLAGEPMSAVTFAATRTMGRPLPDHAYMSVSDGRDSQTLRLGELFERFDSVSMEMCAQL